MDDFAIQGDNTPVMLSTGALRKAGFILKLSKYRSMDKGMKKRLRKSPFD
ncbi:MAG TPA: hypothetical protein PLM49_00245 [Bacteroidales bacterium]|nr:hypothetical protein [Bacteroidales bacterium]